MARLCHETLLYLKTCFGYTVENICAAVEIQAVVFARWLINKL